MNAAWLTRSYAHAGCSIIAKPVRHLKIYRKVIRLCRSYSQASTAHHGSAPTVAIIGSGPAGFYTARKLMRDIHGTKVDMYERLPVPFGLVRFGVAPDHPEVKNCQDEFEQVAASPDFRFIGNVQVGQDLPLKLMSENYDAIVFSYGASKDRQLGLEGEDKPNIYSARAFVGWYNGLPEYGNLNPNLRAGDTAIVVGQGNVALDIARILLSDASRLRKTDLTESAFYALQNSTIKHVRVVGRRGPMQAAFTIKEIRELIQLEGVNFAPIPEELFPPDIKKLERPKRRMMELLKKGKYHDPNATKSWSLEFLLAPSSLNWSQENSDELTGVTFTRTQLDDIFNPSSKVTSTENKTTLNTATLFRSIGYRAEPIPGMDQIRANFDPKSGTLRHDGLGRIIPLDAINGQAATSDSEASLYCAGWVKRGPTGVIASTMTDAFQTAEAIAEDWKKIATQPREEKLGWHGVKKAAEAQSYNLTRVVDWDGWHRIDEIEKKAGKAVGKPRAKYASVEGMLYAAGVP